MDAINECATASVRKVNKAKEVLRMKECPECGQGMAKEDECPKCHHCIICCEC